MWLEAWWFCMGYRRADARCCRPQKGIFCFEMDPFEIRPTLSRCPSQTGSQGDAVMVSQKQDLKVMPWWRHNMFTAVMPWWCHKNRISKWCRDGVTTCLLLWCRDGVTKTGSEGDAVMVSQHVYCYDAVMVSQKQDLKVMPWGCHNMFTAVMPWWCHENRISRWCRDGACLVLWCRDGVTKTGSQGDAVMVSQHVYCCDAVMVSQKQDLKVMPWWCHNMFTAVMPWWCHKNRIWRWCRDGVTTCLLLWCRDGVTKTGSQGDAVMVSQHVYCCDSVMVSQKQDLKVMPWWGHNMFAAMMPWWCHKNRIWRWGRDGVTTCLLLWCRDGVTKTGSQGDAVMVSQHVYCCDAVMVSQKQGLQVMPWWCHTQQCIIKVVAVKELLVAFCWGWRVLVLTINHAN